ncbi:MAG: rod shape-determining protein MreD [Tissierellaceae bacterium]|nr:rod shape-determining protein MreD [Tissierellaceae bacterium]
MAITSLLLIILINIIFQSTILPYLSLFGHIPNTGLIFVILVALRKGKYYGSFFGLALGLIQDILFGQAVGVNALIFFVIGYLIGMIQDVLDVENVVIPILSSAICTILYNFSFYTIMFFLSRDIPREVMIKNVFSIEILYNVIFATLIYKLFSKIFVLPDLRFSKR